MKQNLKIESPDPDLACHENERFWIKALIALDLDSSLAFRLFKPKRINIFVGERLFNTFTVFKSANNFDEGYGQTTGLVFIDGQAYVVDLNGMILRRSTLSLRVLYKIDSYVEIADLSKLGLHQSDLTVDNISIDEMNQFYQGKATANHELRQFQSTWYYLKNLNIPVEDLLLTIRDWIYSLDLSDLDEDLLSVFAKVFKEDVVQIPEVYIAVFEIFLERGVHFTSDMFLVFLQGFGNMHVQESDLMKLYELITNPVFYLQISLTDFCIEIFITLYKRQVNMFTLPLFFKKDSVFAPVITTKHIFTLMIIATNPSSFQTIVDIITNPDFGHRLLVKEDYLRKLVAFLSQMSYTKNMIDKLVKSYPDLLS